MMGGRGKSENVEGYGTGWIEKEIYIYREEEREKEKRENERQRERGRRGGKERGLAAGTV